MAKSYNWTGSGSAGDWNDPNNWNDLTTPANPATSAPGGGDTVTFGLSADITSGGSAYQLFNSAALTVGAAITAQYFTDNSQVEVTSTLTTSALLEEKGKMTIDGSGVVQASATSSAGTALSIDNGGAIDVSGSSASLTTTGALGVAGTGSGALTIEGGANVNADDAVTTAAFTIGFAAGSDGTTTVTGAQSKLSTNGGGINVGYSGVGYLNVLAGATVTVASSNPQVSAAAGFGRTSSGQGFLKVSGSGSTFQSTSALIGIGATGGTGTALVEQGGTLDVSGTNQGLSIGQTSAATGTVTVTGSGSSINAKDATIYVGGGGKGELDVAAGATVDAGQVIIAADATSGSPATPSQATVEGAGSKLTISDALYVGNSGFGVLSIEVGGVVEMTGANASIVIARSSGSAGALSVYGAGSSLDDASGLMAVGYDGGGGLIVDDAATATINDLVVAFGASSGSPDGPSSVIVNGGGSRLTVMDELIVGDDGYAILAVENGAVLHLSGFTPLIEVGASIGSFGAVAVSGEDSLLDAANADFILGDGGLGDLTVDDAATAKLYNLFVAQAASSGSAGNATSVTVTGGGSSLTVADDLTVGGAGIGSLTVSAGATLSVTGANGAVLFGVDDDAHGAATVGGSGSLWMVDAGTFHLGEGGHAEIAIQAGATMSASAPTLSLGVLSAGSGTLSLFGVGSTFDFDDELFVGEAGNGLFEVASGASWTTSHALDVAEANASKGVIDVNGGGALTTLAIDDDLRLGVHGAGTLTMSSGALVTVRGSIDDGIDDDASGYIDVAGSGTATTLTVEGDVNLGMYGHGELNISAGGEVVIDGNLNEAINAGASSKTTISDGAAPPLTIRGDYYVGVAGTADDTFSNGLTVVVQGAISIGVMANGVGTVTLNDDDTTLQAGSGEVTIGDAGTGTVDIRGGALFDASSNVVTLAAQDGSSGTLSVDDDGSQLTAYSLIVGGGGSGSAIAADGGLISVLDDLTIGDQSGADGTLTIADASTLEDHSSLTVGDDDSGLLLIDGDATIDGSADAGTLKGGSGQITVNVGTATFNGALTLGALGSGALLAQLGATVTAKAVTLGESLGGIGTLTVDDDATSVTTGALTIGATGAGTLTVAHGGALTTNDDATLGEFVSANIDTATLDTQGSWTVDDGLTIGDAGIASTSVKGGGSLLVGGDLTLGAQGAASGELDVGGAASTATYGGTLTIGAAGKGGLNITSGGLVEASNSGSGAIVVAAQSHASGTVTVDGAGSLLSGKILVVNAAGTLTISKQGVVAVSSVTLANGASVSLAGGALKTDPIRVDAGGAISGFGTLTGAITDNSTITASGGLLEITGAMSGAGALTIANGATLQLGGADSVSVGFAPGTHETLTLGAPLLMHGVIGGFASGDLIDFATTATSVHRSVSGQTLTVSDGGGGALANLVFASGVDVSSLTVSLSGGEVSVACFVRGTRILTTRGEVAVEALAVGARAMLAGGGSRPIVWLGHRSVDARRHPTPESVWPVVVRAGAFADNLPCRDLWLSPGHNLALDDVLAPVCSLTNGVSIEQIKTDTVEYWHVELDAHDLILAEGLPAESYLDAGNRTAFENGGAFIEAHPNFAPRHGTETCLPLATSGAPIERARARLIARLLERGFEIEDDADAHVLVDGARIEPMRIANRRLAFLLPAGGRHIALRSRTHVPAHTNLESADTRELGLCVRRLAIDGASAPLDRGALAGWREAEFADGVFSHRWTQGAAPLPVGARVVLVELAGSGRYWRRSQSLKKASTESSSPGGSSRNSPALSVTPSSPPAALRK